MSIRRIAPFALAGLLLAHAVVAQDDRDVPAALRPYMTAEEYRAAGLHKLNPAELAQFQAWFVRTMRSSGEDPLARVPEARIPVGPSGDTRLDEIALERRRLAEERRQLQAERDALAAQRDAQAGEASASGQVIYAPDDVRNFGMPHYSGRTNRIEVRVIGTFRGWDGPTQYRLDNGQVWETVGGSRWSPRGAMENPTVVIRSGMLGSYSIQVEGYNTRVQIKRLE